jgi:predicted amidohydrolase
MSTQGTVRIAGVQCDPKLGDLSANLEAMLRALGVASAAGARLVVFPECALTGYGFATKDAALPFAEPVDGPSTRRLAEECARLDVGVVFGLIEREGERLFNACTLVGPQGPIASYRKIHLPFLGVDRFTTPGDRPFAVHEIHGVRVGMHICYDGSFPESGRVLSLLGADLLVLPTNWPTHSECAAEHMVATRAMENNVYVIAVNRVGEESGFRYIGGSSIVDPSGRKLARAGGDEAAILYADVDPARARQKRLVRVPGLHEIDRMADRRPECYGAVVRPNR